ncbi:hypothetical protein LO763_17230 [Glycomyces sp. A-F 0318]|uniref:hypothetical protein n=1 Tax=Glycomyces amatae TaxID=2881355 RepID=UPI001E37AE0E|nr:hypothetical protein [Glycomyces amatae]MCD0445359.1 hypothetical protein [Glycomyces amatae]
MSFAERPGAADPTPDDAVRTSGTADWPTVEGTSGPDTGGKTTGGAEDTADTARRRGTEMAHTAADEAKNVAGTVREEGRELADEAKAEIRHLAEDTRAQLREQTAAQAEKLGDSLRRFGDQFSALAEGRPEDAGPLADYAESAAGEMRRVAARMQDDGFDGVLDDTRRFARERPAMFLGAAVVAGFAAGRLLRGGNEVRKEHPRHEGAERGSDTEPTGARRPDRWAGEYQSNRSDRDYRPNPPVGEYRTGREAAAEETPWR